MSDSISILIRAILEKSSKSQLESELKSIEKNLKPLVINANVDKVKEKYKILESGVKDLQSVITTTTTRIGEQVQTVAKVDLETKKLIVDTETVTINYKKQQEVLVKINAEQSKYWAQRRKETLDSMVSKPSGLAQMADYYKGLEKESLNVAKIDEKRQQVESRYWMERRKETLDSMTSKNTELQQMGRYYTQLEKETAEEARQNGLIKERIALYREQLTIKNRDLKTTYGSSYDEKGMTSIVGSANLLNANDFKTVDELNKATKQLDLQVANSTAGMKELRKQATLAMKESDGFFTTIGKDFQKMIAWTVVGTALFGAFRQLKEGITYISELDNSLNEIRIVTGNTQEEVQKLANSYNSLAKEMSVTTSEIAGTAANLFRQGLDDSQVEERMKSIITYAKISSISLEQSDKIITATANATGESVGKIIDIFSLLGDTTSSNAEEIGEALQRVASAAENSNISLEKSASWISTISSISRESASTIGRSINSIISRYESIKKTGFNSDDPTKLNDVVLALSQIGITATDSQGQLRDFATVMDEVGAKFNTLDKNEKAYIATTMFGTFQRNRGITLLSNYNDSLKNYENALNSAGTAEQKLGIYQESTAAKMDRAKASIEGFWQGTLDSSTLKLALDGFSGLIDILDILINNSFSQFIIQVGLSSTVIYGLYKGVKLLAGTEGMMLLNNVIKALTVNTVSFQLTLGLLTEVMLASPLFSIVLGTAALFAIIKGVDALTVSLEEQKETVQTLTSDFEKLKIERDKLQDKNNRTEQEEKELTVLQAQVKAKQDLLAVEAKRLVNKEYNGARNSTTILFSDKTSNKTSDIKKSIAELQQSYDNLKKSYDQPLNSDNIEKLASKQDKLKEKINQTKDSLGTEYTTIKNNIKILEDAGQQGSKEYQTLSSLATAIEEVINQTKNFSDATEDNTKKTNKVTDSIDNQKEAVDTLAESYKQNASKIKDLSGFIDELNDKGLTESSIEKILTDYPQYIDFLDDEKKLRQELNKGIDEYQNKIDDAYVKTRENSSEFYNSIKNANVDLFNGLAEAYGNDVTNWSNLAQAKQAINAKLISALGQQWEKYFDAFNAGSALVSPSSIGDFRRMENGSAVGIDSATAQQFELLNALNEAARKQAEKFKNLNVSSSLANGAKNSSSPSPIDYTDTTKAHVESYNSLVEIDKVQEKLLKKQISTAEKAKDYNVQIRLQNDLLIVQQKTVKDLQTANEGLHQEANKVRANSAYDTSAWFDITGRDQEQYINLLNSFAGKTDKWSKQQVENIKSTHDALQTIQSAWRENVEAVDLYSASLEDTVQKARDLLVQIAEKQIDIDLASLKTASDLRIASIQSQIDALNEQKDIEEELKQIEEARNKISEAQLSLEKAKLKLENTKNEKNTRLYKDGKFEYVANPNAVKDAQNDVDNANKSLLDAKQSYYNTLASIAQKAEQKALQDQIDTEKKKQDEAQKAADNMKKIIEEGGKASNEVLATALENSNITLGTGMGTMLSTTTDYVNQMVSQLQRLIDKQNEAGLSTGSTTNTNTNTNTTANTTTDLSNVGLQGSSATNAANRFRDLLAQGVDSSTAYKMAYHLDGYESGGAIRKTGLALVHEDEYMLNKETVKDLGGVKGVESLVKDSSIISLVKRSLASGGYIPVNEIDQLHAGKYVLNSPTVSLLGGRNGVENLISNLNMPKVLSANNIVRTTTTSSTTEKPIVIQNANFPHVYDTSGLVRNVNNYRRK